jgi:hypothetical protein
VLPESIEVRLAEPTVTGTSVRIRAIVTALSTASIDVGAIRTSIAGATPDEVRDALAPLGAVDVNLWPGWVATVPALDWRIDVRVEGSEGTSPASSAATSP